MTTSRIRSDTENYQILVFENLAWQRVGFMNRGHLSGEVCNFALRCGMSCMIIRPVSLDLQHVYSMCVNYVRLRTLVTSKQRERKSASGESRVQSDLCECRRKFYSPRLGQECLKLPM